MSILPLSQSPQQLRWSDVDTGDGAKPIISLPHKAEWRESHSPFTPSSRGPNREGAIGMLAHWIHNRPGRGEERCETSDLRVRKLGYLGAGVDLKARHDTERCVVTQAIE